jgi:hypothetical protein
VVTIVVLAMVAAVGAPVRVSMAIVAFRTAVTTGTAVTPASITATAATTK